MKYISKLLIPSIVLILGITFNACKKDTVQSKGIYITGAQVSPIKVLGVDNNQASLDISASSSDIADEDITVNFAIEPSAVETFNKKNGTVFKMLPAAFCSLSTTSTTLKRGNTVSDLIKLLIKPLDASVSADFNYLVPVVITNASGGSPLLDASKIIFVKISRIITAPALRLSDELTFNVASPIETKSYTIEMRLKADGLSFNNQALFYAGEPEIYARFGDVVIQTNQLQIKMAGKIQPNSKTLFQDGKWYHIALVFDGKALTFSIYVNGILDSTVPVPPEVTFKISRMGFSGGFRGEINELRFWKIARTQVEISNNACAVNPSASGLVGYWKMDEGKGNSIKDYSGNNHTGTTKGASWSIDASKCSQ